MYTQFKQWCNSTSKFSSCGCSRVLFQDLPSENKLSIDSRFLDWGLNPELAKHEAGVLHTTSESKASLISQIFY
jgi:hypothetical protein